MMPSELRLRLNRLQRRADKLGISVAHIIALDATAGRLADYGQQPQPTKGSINTRMSRADEIVAHLTP